MCQFTFSVVDKERIMEENDPDTATTTTTNTSDTASATTIPRSVTPPLSEQSPKTRDIGKVSSGGEELLFRRVHYYRDKWVKKEAPPVYRTDRSRLYNAEDLPPLHRAAAMGNVEELAKLLEDNERYQVDSRLDYQTHIVLDIGFHFYFEGCTPLHLTAWHGQLKAMRFLLDRGADIHARTKFGEQTLWFAISGLFPDKMFYPLVKAGADIYATNPSAGTVNLLEEACASGRTSIVSFLLSKNVGFDSENSSDNRLLVYALVSGNLQIFEMLLEHGVTSYASSDTYKVTTMHYAAKWGLLPAIQTLLENGVAATVRDCDDAVPIHKAYIRGNVDAEGFTCSWSDSSSI